MDHNSDYHNINKLKGTTRKKILELRSRFDEFTLSKNNNLIYDNIKLLIDNMSHNMEDKQIIDSYHVNSDAPSISNVTKLSKKYFVVALYYYLPGEPDLFKLMIEKHKLCYALPKIYDDNIKMIRYNIGDPLEKTDISGLYQPVSHAELVPDVIVMPALAISVTGRRLGYGMGYYDKYISSIKKIFKSIITIGTCYHDALLEYVPYSDHDLQLNHVVTDKIILKL